jgi:hypothetical protein
MPSQTRRSTRLKNAAARIIQERFRRRTRLRLQAQQAQAQVQNRNIRLRELETRRRELEAELIPLRIQLTNLVTYHEEPARSRLLEASSRLRAATAATDAANNQGPTSATEISLRQTAEAPNALVEQRDTYESEYTAAGDAYNAMFREQIYPLALRRNRITNELFAIQRAENELNRGRGKKRQRRATHKRGKKGKNTRKKRL